MPSVSKYSAYHYEGFGSGYVREADSSRLDESEMFEALNVQLGVRGELKYRNGYVAHSSNVAQDVKWIFPWREPDSTDHLIIVDALGNILEDTLDGTFTDSTYDTGLPSGLVDHGVTFAAAKDKLYISSRVMATDPVSYDGTTWATVAAIPLAKVLIHHHERLFAMNDAANVSRVYFSNLGLPEAFDALDYIDVSPNDGYGIHAAIVFGDDIIIFKERQIWKLAGRTPESYSLYQIDGERGCVSPKTIALLSGRLIFFDRNTGVWAFDGANFEMISQPINQHILDDQTYSTAYEAAGYVSKENRYYLSMDVD